MDILPMCERCDALCCRAYDIYDSASETFVKRAGVACSHLANNRCSIYHDIPDHAGYRESCHQYDCMEWGPNVTVFLRRIPDTIDVSGMTTSLLETIRLRVMKNPELRSEILIYSEKLLKKIAIDNSLSLSVKLARVQIERFRPPKNQS